MAAAAMKNTSRNSCSRADAKAPRVRDLLPPGVEAIRISSNENPLGPGKAAIDAILGKFPEANRYPFNSTPLDADLEILIAKLNNAQARERRARRRLAGAAEERGARVHVADQASGRARRRPSATAPASRRSTC